MKNKVTLRRFPKYDKTILSTQWIEKLKSLGVFVWNDEHYLKMIDNYLKFNEYYNAAHIADCYLSGETKKALPEEVKTMLPGLRKWNYDTDQEEHVYNPRPIVVFGRGDFYGLRFGNQTFSISKPFSNVDDFLREALECYKSDGIDDFIWNGKIHPLDKINSCEFDHEIDRYK